LGWQLTTPAAATEYVFGTASVSETEAVLIAAFLAAVLAIWGIITQRIVTRRATTLQLLFHNDSDKDLLEARNKFIELTSTEGGLGLADPGKFSSTDAHAIRLVLNGHERLSLGLQFGILDWEFVRRHSRSAIVRDWTLAAPFIYKLRAEYENPALYYEFEHLARSLEGNKMPKRGYRWRLWF
jgi:Domain of unknown function (DUF4760)